MAVSIDLIARPLRGFLRRYIVNTPHDYDDFIGLKDDVYATLAAFLTQIRHGNPSFKIQLRANVQFHKDIDVTTVAEAYLNSNQCIVVRASVNNDVINQIFAEVHEKINEWCDNGSNWVVDVIKTVELHVASYRPLRAGLYLPLPPSLQNKKGLINVRNERDNKCFLWSILAALYPPKSDPQRVSKYKRMLESLQQQRKIDCSDLNYPTSLEDIQMFEKKNNMCINVYGFDDETEVVLPVYNSMSNSMKKINLLLLESEDTHHYCLIKNLNQFLSSQRGGYRKKYVCPIGFQNQNSAVTHLEHMLLCSPGSSHIQKTRVPSKFRNELKFRGTAKKLRQTLMLSGDVECILEPYDTASPNPSTSSTANLNKHTPSGCSVVSILQCCGKPEYPKMYTYRGPNTIEKFLKNIIENAEEHQKRLDSASKVPVLTAKQENDFMKASLCHICEDSLSLCGVCQNAPSATQRCLECRRNVVRDHCHCCSKFRGAAHARCNLELQMKRDVVVGMHNLRRYDSHLIMQEIGSLASRQGIKLECIPRGIEDYIMIALNMSWGKKKYQIKFIDTIQFLPSSLENLVENLAKDGDSRFHVMRKYFPDKASRQLLLRKGVFPYEYMSSFEKFKDKKLPRQEELFSKLTGLAISDKDYRHAKNVWKRMNISNLGEYQDLYVKTDTLLLADVFENFRTFCLKHYKLDPAHYFTLPGIGWDASLAMSKTSLDLLTNKAMYEFFESGIRGGFSCIVKRFAKANNPYLSKYDEDRPTSYIMHLDANNLYGFAMTQYLPVRGFRWLLLEEINDLPDVRKISKTSPIGYVYEVDLVYPEELHDHHDDIPLAPEQMAVTPDMLSPYCRDALTHAGITSAAPMPKLITNLNKKSNYIVHYQNLQLYLKEGMIIDKIHRVLQFEQEPWMQNYILFNTEMRKQATTDFKKDLFKLLNNSVFGKSMENVRAYVDVKLVTNAEVFQRLVAKPNYVRSQAFNEHLVAVLMQRNCVNLAKPIYVGFSVLELSKRLIYKFHYTYMKKKFPNCELLFTDTDSLTYYFETADIYIKTFNWVVMRNSIQATISLAIFFIAVKTRKLWD